MNDTMIYKSMCNAIADIGTISKNKVNQQQKFHYRGIDDVMNALYPVLAKHRLFLVPEVLDQRREERQTKSGGNIIFSVLKVRYTMYAEDGSNVSAVVIGEGMDSADKGSNKAMAAAMKYAIFQMFCIPTEEMVKSDPDAYTPESNAPKNSRISNPSGCNADEDQRSDFDYKQALLVFKTDYNLTTSQIYEYRAKLIASGAIEAKSSDAMTENEWNHLFDAIIRNFLSESA